MSGLRESARQSKSIINIFIVSMNTRVFKFKGASLFLLLGDPGVDGLRVMLHHLPNESLGDELLKRLPGEGAAQLETLAHDRRRD